MSSSEPNPFQTNSMRMKVTTALAFIALLAIIWGFGSSLRGAVIVPSVIEAAGRNVAVRSLVDGRITDLKVRDGDYVEAGQTLFVVDPVQSEVDLNIAKQQLAYAAIALSAHEAEMRGEIKFAMPPRIHKFGLFVDAVQIRQDALTALQGRQSNYREQLAGYTAREAATRDQREGLIEERASNLRQVAIFDDELEASYDLLEKGLIARPRVLALERQREQLIGRNAVIDTELRRLQNTLLEVSAQSAALTAERQSRTLDAIRENRERVTTLQEEIKAAQSRLVAQTVTAPINGYVLNAVVNAADIAVMRNDQVLQIVPIDQGLVVRGKLNPGDADVVTAGQESRIRFSALPQFDYPELRSSVRQVGADILINETTGEPYVSITLELDAADSPMLAEYLTPGLPVDAYITTGERSPISFLVQPLMNSLARAWKEE